MEDDDSHSSASSSSGLHGDNDFYADVMRPPQDAKQHPAAANDACDVLVEEIAHSEDSDISDEHQEDLAALGGERVSAPIHEPRASVVSLGRRVSPPHSVSAALASREASPVLSVVLDSEVASSVIEAVEKRVGALQSKIEAAKKDRDAAAYAASRAEQLEQDLSHERTLVAELQRQRGVLASELSGALAIQQQLQKQVADLRASKGQNSSADTHEGADAKFGVLETPEATTTTCARTLLEDEMRNLREALQTTSEKWRWAKIVEESAGKPVSSIYEEVLQLRAANKQLRDQRDAAMLELSEAKREVLVHVTNRLEAEQAAETLRQRLHVHVLDDAQARGSKKRTRDDDDEETQHQERADYKAQEIQNGVASLEAAFNRFKQLKSQVAATVPMNEEPVHVSATRNRNQRELFAAEGGARSGQRPGSVLNSDFAVSPSHIQELRKERELRRAAEEAAEAAEQQLAEVVRRASQSVVNSECFAQTHTARKALETLLGWKVASVQRSPDISSAYILRLIPLHDPSCSGLRSNAVGEEDVSVTVCVTSDLLGDTPSSKAEESSSRSTARILECHFWSDSEEVTAKYAAKEGSVPVSKALFEILAAANHRAIRLDKARESARATAPPAPSASTPQLPSCSFVEQCAAAQSRPVENIVADIAPPPSLSPVLPQPKPTVAETTIGLLPTPPAMLQVVVPTPVPATEPTEADHQLEAVCTKDTAVTSTSAAPEMTLCIPQTQQPEVEVVPLAEADPPLPTAPMVSSIPPEPTAAPVAPEVAAAVQIAREPAVEPVVEEVPQPEIIDDSTGHERGGSEARVRRPMTDTAAEVDPISIGAGLLGVVSAAPPTAAVERTKTLLVDEKAKDKEEISRRTTHPRRVIAGPPAEATVTALANIVGAPTPSAVVAAAPSLPPATTQREVHVEAAPAQPLNSDSAPSQVDTFDSFFAF